MLAAGQVRKMPLTDVKVHTAKCLGTDARIKHGSPHPSIGKFEDTSSTESILQKAFLNTLRLMVSFLARRLFQSLPRDYACVTDSGTLRWMWHGC